MSGVAPLGTGLAAPNTSLVTIGEAGVARVELLSTVIGAGHSPCTCVLCHCLPNSIFIRIRLLAVRILAITETLAAWYYNEVVVGVAPQCARLAVTNSRSLPIWVAGVAPVPRLRCKGFPCSSEGTNVVLQGILQCFGGIDWCWSRGCHWSWDNRRNLHLRKGGWTCHNRHRHSNPRTCKR